MRTIPNENNIYKYIVEHPNCTNHEIAEHFNIYPEIVENFVNRLKELGVLFLPRPHDVYRIRIWSAKNNAHHCIVCKSLQFRNESNGVCTRCFNKRYFSTLQQKVKSLYRMRKHRQLRKTVDKS